jgi:hypothetical protein
MSIILNKAYNILRNIFLYATGLYAVKYAQTFLQHSSPSKLIINLKKMYPIIRPKPVRYLISLFEYTISLNEAPIPLIEHRSIIFSCCTWGESYTNKLINTLLPSLCAPDNIPKLAKKYNIIFLIYSDTISKNKIEASLSFQLLHKHVQYQYITIPSPLLNRLKKCTAYPKFSIFKKINQLNEMLKYFLLGATQTHSLKIACNHGAYASFLMPDMAFSRDFFSFALSNSENRIGVLGTTFRTDAYNAQLSLNKFYTDSYKTALSIDSKDLSEIIINNIHEAAKNRIVSKDNNYFVPSPQLIFKIPEGYIIRSFNYHPILINCKLLQTSPKKIHYDYQPIDKYMLEKFINHTTNVETDFFILKNSSRACFIELSEPDLEKITTPKTQEQTHGNTVLKTIYSYSKKHQNTFESLFCQALASVKTFICLESQNTKKQNIDDVFMDEFINYSTKQITSKSNDQ